MTPRGSRGSYNQGENSPAAKLREADVLEIRDLYASRVPGDGVSQYSLAAQFGVHRSTVQQAVAARTWRHI
jgi:DNA-binding GntR family transcriptional regulator